MKKQDYTATILVNATPDKAFKSINNVAAWWTEDVEGRSDNLNDVLIIRFGEESFVTIKIVEFVRNEKVAWIVTDCYLQWFADKKEWTGTRMVFELSAKGNSTSIQLTHVGLEPQVECYDNCVKGWDQYFNGSLASLLNEGQGNPQKKPMATSENGQ